MNNKGTPLNVAYTPWTKAELQIIAKEFPKITHSLAEKFNIVIQTYEPGFSYFCQLIYMLMG